MSVNYKAVKFKEFITNTGKLSEQINDFIEDSEATIVDIKYSTTSTYDRDDERVQVISCALVAYKLN